MSLIQRYPDRLKAAVNFYGPDHGSAARVFPISENPRVELLTEFGQFTSACGLTRYLGDVFPDEYRRASFVAEPVHNLVHVDFWSEEGATSVARRGRENIEFLASTDGWFRPVYFYIGPDGALYLVDYYRESIEHPEWMSSEHHHHDSPDLYTGTERGARGRSSSRSHLAAAHDSEWISRRFRADSRRAPSRLPVGARRLTGRSPQSSASDVFEASALEPRFYGLNAA